MSCRVPSSRRVATALALLALAPRAALAHPGRAIEPHDLWRAWTLAPAVLGAFVVATWLYARGLGAYRHRAGRGRVVPRWRVWCHALAWLALLVALVSPLDAMGGALFSAHMVQHLLLMMIAAPLYVAGDAMSVSLWALPVSARRAVGAWWLRHRRVRGTWRLVARPGVAWLLHVGALWLWHAPSFYDRALVDARVHVLEHVTFFATALLFWWVILRPHGRRLGAGPAVVYLFAAALQSTLLGALLALARHPLYAAHFGTTRAWGFTPLEDQQLAGLLMWVPAGLVYLTVLVPLALRMLRAPAAQRPRALAVAGVSTRGTP